MLDIGRGGVDLVGVFVTFFLFFVVLFGIVAFWLLFSFFIRTKGSSARRVSVE